MPKRVKNYPWSIAQRQRFEQNLDRAYDKIYDRLAKKYGQGAGTTYIVLRQNHTQPAAFSLAAMRKQVSELPPFYSGIDTVPFRRMRCAPLPHSPSGE